MEIFTLCLLFNKEIKYFGFYHLTSYNELWRHILSENDTKKIVKVDKEIAKRVFL